MDAFEQQIAELQRRRQVGAQGAGFNAPQGKMVSGRYVKANPLEYLAEALRGAGQSRDSVMAGDEMNALQDKRQKAIADALRGFQSELNPSQAGTGATNMVNDALPPEMRIGAQPQITRKADPMSAYGKLAESGIGDLQKLGYQGMLQVPQLQAQAQERDENRAFRQQESQMAREARAQELQLRMQDARASQVERLAAQKELREMQIQAQKDTQRMIAANRPERQAQIIQTDQGPMQLVNGQAVPIMGPGGKPVMGTKPVGTAKPLTESQAKGSLYLGQMRTANDELDALAKKGVSSSPAAVAATKSTWTNWASGKDAQQVGQLQNQWSEGFLRAKTGAAATAGEVELNNRTFFPVVGDSKEVIAQKAKMRRQAEKDMEIVAGNGADRAGGGEAAPVGIVDFGSLK